MLSNRKWYKISHPLLQFVIEYYYHDIEGDKIGRIFKGLQTCTKVLNTLCEVQ